MSKEFSHLDKDEKIQAENDFLKMKLMLEHGARFGSGDSGNELPVEIENQFLNNILKFEKEYAENKKIKVFDKIRRPKNFKPVNDIPEREIESAWKNLDEYLRKFGISLSVCSPNVSHKELYRFAIEELFGYEIDDMNVPGMMTCFIYDEYHPDYEYENSRCAVEECMELILRKDPLQWMYNFQEEYLKLNGHYPLTRDDLQVIVNRFKDSYENIHSEITSSSCIIDEKICSVKGDYKLTASLSPDEILIKGTWLVEFDLDEDLGYWSIVNVQIQGINF